MKVGLVVIFAISILTCSGRSFADTHQPAEVKSQGQMASAGSAAGQITEAKPGESASSRDDQIVVVDIPFSSLQLDPSLAEYLGLSSAQIRAIQHLMAQE